MTPIDEIVTEGKEEMRGSLRCIDGRIFRHDPQCDDPEMETYIGQCPDCGGDGCGEDGEPTNKQGRIQQWLRDPDYELEKQMDDKDDY